MKKRRDLHCFLLHDKCSLKYGNVIRHKILSLDEEHRT